MLRNVTHELVDIHGTGQQCPTLHEWQEDRIMTDKMCLVMNVFNHVDGDEDVVYRYRIYAGKRFIDALEKVMFDEDNNCFPSRTHAKANKLLQDLRWEYHKRCWHDNLGVLIDDGLIRAGVSLDVFAYRDVEPMAVGGES